MLIGLVLTFVLGASVGSVLSSMEPPSGGATVPLFGWSLAGGDLRPAHFVGIHAEQLLPLFGYAVAATRVRHANAYVWAAALAYSGLFVALMTWGLTGRV